MGSDQKFRVLRSTPVFSLLLQFNKIRQFCRRSTSYRIGRGVYTFSTLLTLADDGAPPGIIAWCKGKTRCKGKVTGPRRHG